MCYIVLIKLKGWCVVRDYDLLDKNFIFNSCDITDKGKEMCINYCKNRNYKIIDFLE